VQLAVEVPPADTGDGERVAHDAVSPVDGATDVISATEPVKPYRPDTVTVVVFDEPF
jgi:hypothetical protein